MTNVDRLLAFLLFAFAAATLANSIRIAVSDKPTRLVRGMPPHRRAAFVGTGLLVTCGLVVEGFAVLSRTSFLGLVGSLILLAGILTRIKAARPVQ